MPATGSRERAPDDRLRRVSSTPRPIDPITAVSGILDHPLARMMTAVALVDCVPITVVPKMTGLGAAAPAAYSFNPRNDRTSRITSSGLS